MKMKPIIGDESQGYAMLLLLLKVCHGYNALLPLSLAVVTLKVGEPERPSPTLGLYSSIKQCHNLSSAFLGYNPTGPYPYL